MKKSTYTLISLLLLVGMYCAASVSYALDAPHNPVGGVDCDLCHYPAGTTPDWTSVPSSTVTTPLNALCATCHRDTNLAVMGEKFAFVKTHSSFETNPTASGSDVYLIECRTCHNPHLQDQMRALPADGNLDFGTTTSVTATLLTDVTKSWDIGQFEDAVLIPNTAYIAYAYRITGNSKDTLTIEGAMKTMAPYTGVGKPYRIKYGKMVKNLVVTPRSGTKPVTFLNNSGSLNSFASTTATVKGVCQVCHTKTKYFLGSGAVLDAGGHPASYDANCTVSCHQHKYGFKAGGCTGCHGQSGSSGAPLIGTDLVTPATGHSFGAHPKHAETLNIGCETCHAGNGMPTEDQKLTIAFSGKATGGLYQGINNLLNGYSYNAPPVTFGATETCSSIYCHSSGQSADGASATPDYATPNWELPASGACGTCHKTTTGTTLGLIDTGSHTMHLAADTNCGNCHNGASALAYVSASHVNQSIDVANSYTMGGAAGNGYGACSAASCHGNPYAAGSITTPAWGSTGSGCAACHTGANVITANGPATGSHTTHMGLSGAACTQCHNAGTSSTTAPATEHADTLVDTAGVGYTDEKAKGSPYVTCSTSQCHGSSSGTWGTPNPDTLCVTCHGAPGTNDAGYSANNKTAAPGYNGTGVDTANNNGAPLSGGVSGDQQVGAHDTHLRGNGDYKTGGIACSDCHAVTALGDPGHMNGATTMNWSDLARNVGTIPYNGDNGAITPGYTTPNCTTNYCHGGGFSAGVQGTGLNPSWIDGTYLANPAASMIQSDCDKCHYSPPTASLKDAHGSVVFGAGACNACHGHDGSGATHINGTLEATGGTCNSCHDYDTVNGDWGKSAKAVEGWGAHAQHIDHLKSLNGIATLDPVADNYTSANFIAVCGTCHTTTQSNHTMNNSSGRMINFGDNAVTYRLNNTVSAVYSGTSGSSSSLAAKTCSNVSCHFQTTPVWQGY